MNGVLLWTERPEPLSRELETHEWMLREHPEVTYDLELRYENRPGDWTEYSRAFHGAWNRAAELGVPLINLESDIVPTHAAFRLLLGCTQRCCTVPYWLNPIPNAWSAYAYRSDGYGTCQVQPHVEEWAIGADLGFVKFGAELVRQMPIDRLPNLSANWQCLNAWLFEYLRSDPFYRQQVGPNGRPKWPTGTLPPILHLHWLAGETPGLHSNHDHWDEGDMRHHRTKRGDDGTVLRMLEGEDHSPRPSIPFQAPPVFR